MSACSRCQLLPAPLAEGGTLFIAPPMAHTQGSLRQFLREAGVPFSEPAPSILAIPLVLGRLRVLGEGLGGVLSQAELRDTRSLVLTYGAELSISDLAAMQPLSTLVAKIQGDWLLETLREDRLTSHFQPIVSCREPGEVFAYECLLRGLTGDGGFVAPGTMYEAARASDLMFQLDRAARLTAIRTAIEHGLDTAGTNLFINFNPTSIYDPSFCLRTTIAAIGAAAFRREQIVFEVVESDQFDDVGLLLRIMEVYRGAGFRVALDDLGSGYGSLNLLSQLKPDFVKLDMRLVRDVDRDPYKAEITRKLLEMARGLGIATIVEGIETRGEWDWAREHGADSAQGYLFARPESPPPHPIVPQDAPTPGRALGNGLAVH